MGLMHHLSWNAQQTNALFLQSLNRTEAVLYLYLYIYMYILYIHIYIYTHSKSFSFSCSDLFVHSKTLFEDSVLYSNYLILNQGQSR